jgi:hypothetical protein
VTQIKIGTMSQVHKKPANHIPVTEVPMVFTHRTGREISISRFSITKA